MATLTLKPTSSKYWRDGSTASSGNAIPVGRSGSNAYRAAFGFAAAALPERAVPNGATLRLWRRDSYAAKRWSFLYSTGSTYGASKNLLYSDVSIASGKDVQQNIDFDELIDFNIKTAFYIFAETFVGGGSTNTYGELYKHGETYAPLLLIDYNVLPGLNGNLPADAMVKAGQTHTMAVEIEEAGSPTSYTYQWYKDGAAIAGATGRTYTTDALAVGSYKYHCVVKNAAGSVTSRSATITVQQSLSIDSTYPRNAAVFIGESATLQAVVLESTGDVAYQWYCNGKAIEGATESQYTTPALTEKFTCYHCMVTMDDQVIPTRPALIMAVAQVRYMTEQGEVAADAQVYTEGQQWQSAVPLMRRGLDWKMGG